MSGNELCVGLVVLISTSEYGVQNDEAPSLFAMFLDKVGWSMHDFELWLHQAAYKVFTGKASSALVGRNIDAQRL